VRRNSDIFFFIFFKYLNLKFCCATGSWMHTFFLCNHFDARFRLYDGIVIEWCSLKVTRHEYFTPRPIKTKVSPLSAESVIYLGNAMLFQSTHLTEVLQRRSFRPHAGKTRAGVSKTSRASKRDPFPFVNGASWRWKGRKKERRRIPVKSFAVAQRMECWRLGLLRSSKADVTTSHERGDANRSKTCRTVSLLCRASI